MAEFASSKAPRATAGNKTVPVHTQKHDTAAQLAGSVAGKTVDWRTGRREQSQSKRARAGCDREPHWQRQCSERTEADSSLAAPGGPPAAVVPSASHDARMRPSASKTANLVPAQPKQQAGSASSVRLAAAAPPAPIERCEGTVARSLRSALIRLHKPSSARDAAEDTAPALCMVPGLPSASSPCLAGRTVDMPVAHPNALADERQRSTERACAAASSCPRPANCRAFGAAAQARRAVMRLADGAPAERMAVHESEHDATGHRHAAGSAPADRNPGRPAAGGSIDIATERSAVAQLRDRVLRSQGQCSQRVTCSGGPLPAGRPAAADSASGRRSHVPPTPRGARSPAYCAPASSAWPLRQEGEGVSMQPASAASALGSPASSPPARTATLQRTGGTDFATAAVPSTPGPSRHALPKIPDTPSETPLFDLGSPAGLSLMVESASPSEVHAGVLAWDQPPSLEASGSISFLAAGAAESLTLDSGRVSGPAAAPTASQGSVSLCSHALGQSELQHRGSAPVATCSSSASLKRSARASSRGERGAATSLRALLSAAQQRPRCSVAGHPAPQTLRTLGNVQPLACIADATRHLDALRAKFLGESDVYDAPCSPHPKGTCSSLGSPSQLSLESVQPGSLSVLASGAQSKDCAGLDSAALDSQEEALRGPHTTERPRSRRPSVQASAAGPPREPLRNRGTAQSGALAAHEDNDPSRCVCSRCAFLAQFAGIRYALLRWVCGGPLCALAVRRHGAQALTLLARREARAQYIRGVITALAAAESILEDPESGTSEVESLEAAPAIVSPRESVLGKRASARLLQQSEVGARRSASASHAGREHAGRKHLARSGGGQSPKPGSAHASARRSKRRNLGGDAPCPVHSTAKGAGHIDFFAMRPAQARS